VAEGSWQHQKVRAEEQQRQLSTRLIEQHVWNKQTIEVRVKSKISDKDFATMKDAIVTEVARIERVLKRLERERAGIEDRGSSNLAGWWQKAESRTAR
jgi:hypothetical protein